MENKLLVLLALTLSLAAIVFFSTSQANSNTVATFLDSDNVAIAESSVDCISDPWTFCWNSNGSYRFYRRLISN